MTKRVLVPLDGSDQSREALEFALAEHPGATVVALHVIDPVEGGYGVGSGLRSTSEEWYEQARAEAEELSEEAAALADDRGVDLETVVEVGRPARTIVETVEDNDVDHVVMGSHGRSGVSRILLGSVAETVVRRSTVPVTVVR